MISLKRYLDVDHAGLLKSIMESYRAALAATGTFGSQACPHLGQEFEESLWNLQKALDAAATPAAVIETEERFETELKQASARAAGYLRQIAGEVKELLTVLALTTESVGERDQRYIRQFHEFSKRLETIADFNDLTKIRSSLVQSALDLKTCVEAMTRDSEKSVGELRAEISSYQNKLVETERLASRDALTSLGNRRRIEFELEHLEQQKRPYCLVMVDVNGLKHINDCFGHVAGDQVLKQFATELVTALRPAGLVGRWGGDEFVVVLSSTPKEAESAVGRIRKWVFGDYSIEADGSTRKVKVSAAIGLAVATAGEPFVKVIERADAEMYRDKTKAILEFSAPPSRMR